MGGSIDSTGGVLASAKLINNKAYNVGFRNGNFTIRQIAEEIKRKFPWTRFWKVLKKLFLVRNAVRVF